MIRSYWRTPRLIDVSGKTEVLRQFVVKLPPGYCEGGKWTALTRFQEQNQTLARAYVDQVKEYDARYIKAVDLLGLFPHWPFPSWRFCPVHIVNDGHRLNIDESVLIWFRQLEGSIDEIPRFQRQLECLPPKIQANGLKLKIN